jgi:hypothetical protein
MEAAATAAPGVVAAAVLSAAEVCLKVLLVRGRLRVNILNRG